MFIIGWLTDVKKIDHAIALGRQMNKFTSKIWSVKIDDTISKLDDVFFDLCAV